MIRVVAPFIFLATSAIWSNRLPLLFIISPRYLCEGTSSNTSSLSFRVFFLPFPFLTTLQIGYGICLRHGLLRRVFRVVFVGRGGSGIHHPSIAASLGCSSVVFLFQGFLAGVLFHP